ncbi:GIY-YIG nuclease family protein [Pelosinus fermentans]|uniref:DUF4357 domain-containing protein n=1 Tax=Pelosinus fermentans JBW45 TaxID=1192197 RepID=I9NXR1_9FIRM|nr:GIY-YIG nuclease family protein [Pelosinus fermentans]AJQ27933.1 protein of unknown function DUF4357 [Pelosinus fermentans JBW45]
MSGKLIRLFLTDGQPNGLRTIEVSNMTIHGTIFPRPQLDKFMMRESAKKPGVYMLLGADEDDPEKKVLYIGEGDPVLPRLKSHAINKDFWTEAIVFSSKDDYLTKTQVKYLEAELYALAKEAYRTKLDNAQIPTKPNISEVDEAEVSQFLDAIKLLLLTLGIDILEPRILVEENTVSIENIFELKVKNVFAKMAIINNKYVVLKGSTSVMDNRPSIPNFLVKLRQDLVDTGIMLNNGNGLYIFMQDATFNSPSYAAAAIVGGAANGRKLWKREGKMLKEIDKEMADNGEERD